MPSIAGGKEQGSPRAAYDPPQGIKLLSGKASKPRQTGGIPLRRSHPVPAQLRHRTGGSASAQRNASGSNEEGISAAVRAHGEHDAAAQEVAGGCGAEGMLHHDLQSPWSVLCQKLTHDKNM